MHVLIGLLFKFPFLSWGDGGGGGGAGLGLRILSVLIPSLYSRAV